MIAGISHVTIFVTDAEQAKAFYTEKLGFEVRSDAVLEGMRWLTVGAPRQPDVELVLVEPQAGPMLQPQHAAMLRELCQAGVLGAGVFRTTDCVADYEALRERGVEFMAPPSPRPYGVEAIFKDCAGNWFSLTQVG